MAEEKPIDVLQHLLTLVTGSPLLPANITEGIKLLNALMSDLGTKMNNEMRTKWIERMEQTIVDCESSKYNMASGAQKILVCTLKSLSGSFYENIAKDYSLASISYEDAANTISSITPDQLREVIRLLTPVVRIQSSLPESNEEEELQAKLQLYEDGFIDFVIDLRLGSPTSSLWDRAADAYCRLSGYPDNAKKCYENGLIAISKDKDSKLLEVGEVNQRMNTLLCHLSISLANLLLSTPGNWEQAEQLYRRATDLVFFGAEKRGNLEYQNMCEILGEAFSTQTGCRPHVFLKIDEKNKEKLAGLRAALGQKALDMLKNEFETSEEGFPVPETFYLLNALGEAYREIGEYEKCANLLNTGRKFDKLFYGIVFAELADEETRDWLIPFVIYNDNVSFVRGLLKKPDYQDFLKNQQRLQDSLQRIELRVIRHEKNVAEKTIKPGWDETKDRLLKSHPWLGNSVNFGDIINAELIRDNIEHQSWSGVVMGYCNAVEEELKRGIYDEYLKFKADFNRSYLAESERQNQKSSVLYFIANEKSRPVWNGFVKSEFPEQERFLAQELPLILSELIGLRKPSAHGRMNEINMAKRAREIVLGVEEKGGLLEKLVGFKTDS